MAEVMGATPNLHDLNLNTHRPFRRGPMYSAYAELREWKLRTKKKLPISPLPPPPSRKSNTPMASRSVQDLSMAFRKENKRPPSTPRHERVPFSTPPPATPKHEVKRAMSTARGGSSELFSMRKSYSCLKELKEFSMAASSAIKEEGRKNVGSLRRQRQPAMVASSSMSMSWMG